MSIKIRNTEETTVAEINRQMLEPRPLPMGRQEFEDWAERILSGALIPEGHEINTAEGRVTQKAALAQMILHLGPTESHKADAYFIHSLRKAACNQVAHAMWKEIEEEKKKKLAEEEAAKAAEAPAAE